MPYSRLWPRGFVIVVTVVGLALVTAYWLLGRDTLKSHSSRSLSGLLKYDGVKLLEGAHESEVRRLGLNRQNLQRLLDTFVRPALAGMTVAGPQRFRASEEEGYVVAYQPLKSPDGIVYEVHMKSMLADNGFTSSPIVHQLFIAGLMGRPEMRAATNSQQRFEAIVMIMSKQLPVLEATGLSGFVREGPQGEMETWRSYTEKFRKLSLRSDNH